MKKIKFPAAIFYGNDKNLEFLDRRILNGDKRMPNPFKNIELIDSDGCIYKIKNSAKDKKIRILDSIYYVGLMVKINIELSEPEKLYDLKSFKTRIIAFIIQNKNKYSNINDYKSLISDVNNANSFKSIIRIFDRGFWFWPKH